MLTTCSDEIDKPEAALSSFRAAKRGEALVLAAKSGSEQAFEILVERHRRKIFAVALRSTHVREDAEDITQQSFQKAFVYLQTFEGKSSFSRWLTLIAVNEALMMFRRGRGRREISIDDGRFELKEAAHLEIPGSDPDPEACYLQREEAARRMGLSLAAVKSRLLHGRRKLREALRCYVTSPRRPGAIAGDARRISRDRLACTACD